MQQLFFNSLYCQKYIRLNLTKYSEANTFATLSRSRKGALPVLQSPSRDSHGNLLLMFLTLFPPNHASLNHYHTNSFHSTLRCETHLCCRMRLDLLFIVVCILLYQSTTFYLSILLLINFQNKKRWSKFRKPDVQLGHGHSADAKIVRMLKGYQWIWKYWYKTNKKEDKLLSNNEWIHWVWNTSVDMNQV